MNNSHHTKYSVRHPRNMWVVRLLVFLTVLPMLDVHIGVLDNISHSTELWAEELIAQNDLERKIEPADVDLEQNQILLAEEVTTEPILQQAKTKPTTMVEGVEQENNIVENREIEHKVLALETKNNATLPEQNKADIHPTSRIDYNLMLSDSYAKMNSKSEDYYKKSSVSWIASGAAGPQFMDAVVSEPTGASYSNVANIDNLKSDALGVNNSSNDQGFVASLNIGVQIGTNFELHSGISFAQVSGSHNAYFDSEVNTTQTIYTSINPDNENGTRSAQTVETQVPVTNYFSDTLRSNYKLSSFEVPLIVKYNFGKRKLNYFVSSGVSTILGSSYSSSFESSQIGTGNLDEVRYGINSVNLLVGVGIQYHATSNISIKFSPGYKYGVQLSNSAAFRSNTSSLGFFTGLNYYFK